MVPEKKRVLVAPLEWGLGHATRCVPVIRGLLREGAEVILAADGRPYEFLEQHFPQLPLVRLPGYGISYPKSSRLGLHLAMRSPGILRRIKAEKENTERIVQEHAIDIIISDNRFACRTSHTLNIYITHQLQVKARFGEKFATRRHRGYYERFDQVWVPDSGSANNLSGELGHTGGDEAFVRYVGPLTRFQDPGPWNSRPMKWWLVVLLSGPEPQRTIFERLVLEELSKFTEETLVVRGMPGETKLPATALPHVTLVNHLEDAELKEALLGAHHVLCRPGYSTLCDLSALGISPIVVPTPGQTEQEYLAQYHDAQRHLVWFPQKKFNLSEAVRQRTHLATFNVFPEPELLQRRIKGILK